MNGVSLPAGPRTTDHRTTGRPDRLGAWLRLLPRRPAPARCGAERWLARCENVRLKTARDLPRLEGTLLLPLLRLSCVASERSGMSPTASSSSPRVRRTLRVRGRGEPVPRPLPSARVASGILPPPSSSPLVLVPRRPRTRMARADCGRGKNRVRRTRGTSPACCLFVSPDAAA
jgi:hypothetical protein